MAEKTGKDKGQGSGSARDNPQHGLVDLMAQTFDERRKNVLEYNLSVRRGLEKYPGLRDFRKLRREFERIIGKNVKTFESHLDCVLKQFAEGQTSRESYKCTINYCKESVKILRKDEQDNARKATARMILYGCAQSEKKWWDVAIKLIEKNGDKRIGRLQPTVLVQGSPFEDHCADVYCERIKVVEGVSFCEAVMSCYFLYYAFNLEYAPVDLEVFKPFDDLLDLMGKNE